MLELHVQDNTLHILLLGMLQKINWGRHLQQRVFPATWSAAWMLIPRRCCWLALLCTRIRGSAYMQEEVRRACERDVGWWRLRRGLSDPAIPQWISWGGGLFVWALGEGKREDFTSKCLTGTDLNSGWSFNQPVIAANKMRTFVFVSLKCFSAT